MISAIERCKYLSLEFIVGSSFSTTGRKEMGEEGECGFPC